MKQADCPWRSHEDNALRRLLALAIVQPEELVLTEEELSLVVVSRQLKALKLVRSTQSL
jgi:hypothetical protein